MALCTKHHRHHGEQPLRTQVAAVQTSGVAVVTIEATYKDLLPDAAQLVPKNFATPEEIARLPRT